jgi:hypothetical protein
MSILPIVISLLMGCTAFVEFLDGNPPPEPKTTDRDSLETALAVYQRGDYTQAARLFNTLSTADGESDQRRTAQVGEICCRLMLADSKADVNAALGRWKTFKYSAANDAWREELALFDPLLGRLSVSADGQKSDPQSPQVSAPPATAGSTQKQLETELTTMKKKAAQTTQLQRQLDAVMAENRTLKQKIKALEAIDQNIQKKKTEISAPSE